ncbi:GNAT family N-acetyltransferase [Nannocystaceae bacterium ST9]
MAIDPSSRALMSALLREIEGWSVIEREGERAVELPLREQGGVIELPLQQPIGVGRMALGQPRWRSSTGEVDPLAIDGLIARLVGEPDIARAIDLDPDRSDRFVARVRASAGNLAALLDARAGDLDALFAEPLDFVAAEQGLVLGHSVHPAPRVREGVDADDRACVPELGGRVQLWPWAVARERLEIGGDPRALAELIADDPAWAELDAALEPGLSLVPLHPLQHRALLDDPELAQARRRGELRPLGPLGRAWSPTSSLRTLHAEHARWMIKASLPVRLTNSARTLSLAELERGLLLGRVLALPELAAWQARHPQLRILREPTWFGFGPIVSRSALRENPFRSSEPGVEMLATLLQDDPRTGVSRLATRLAQTGEATLARAQAWFAAFLERVFVPLVEAQAEHGLLLSAHQQNLVLGLDDALLPTRAWFRDAQGTAYTTLALQRYAEREPGLREACFRSPLAERVWAYSLVINAVFNVIASLAMLPGVGQGALIGQLRECLLDQRGRGLADPRAIEYLLDSPQLWIKANVRAFASGVDEVALTDPLTIYRPLANPLRGASHWHHRGGEPPERLGRTHTGSIEHPRRPSESTSRLYWRRCPAIDRTFTLRTFDRERDFDRFCAWMNDPVVAEFWEQAWPRERLREYIDQRLADPHVIPAIGSFDDRPFAYFEIYWAKEDRLGPHYAADDYDRGFHMAVGDAEFRHRGFGRQWFLSMAHFLFLDDPRTQRLVGEPRIDQARVRAWSTSTAWEEAGEIQFPHKRAVLMILTRERFFAGFEGG